MKQYSNLLKEILIEAQAKAEIDYEPFTNFKKVTTNPSVLIPQVVRNLLRELLEKVFKPFNIPEGYGENVKIFSDELKDVKQLRLFIPNTDVERRRVFRNAERLIIKYSNQL